MSAVIGEQIGFFTSLSFFLKRNIVLKGEIYRTVIAKNLKKKKSLFFLYAHTVRR
jgi:hypothetical protein